MLEERNRLARDLHDSVKQQLFAVNMTLARLLRFGKNTRIRPMSAWKFPEIYLNRHRKN